MKWFPSSPGAIGRLASLKRTYPAAKYIHRTRQVALTSKQLPHSDERESRQHVSTENTSPASRSWLLSDASTLANKIHSSATSLADAHRLYRQLSAEAMWHRHVHHRPVHGGSSRVRWCPTLCHPS